MLMFLSVEAFFVNVLRRLRGFRCGALIPETHTVMDCELIKYIALQIYNVWNTFYVLPVLSQFNIKVFLLQCLFLKGFIARACVL